MKRTTFKITGMRCASCAGRIEKQLGATAGIGRAVVNLAMNELAVEYDEQQITPTAIEAQITALGFGAQQLTAAGELRFGVQGLHCSSCVGTLEKKLLSHPAIALAVVNLAQETAFVTYDPTALSKEQIFALVTDMDAMFGGVTLPDATYDILLNAISGSSPISTEPPKISISLGFQSF